MSCTQDWAQPSGYGTDWGGAGFVFTGEGSGDTALPLLSFPSLPSAASEYEGSMKPMSGPPGSCRGGVRRGAAHQLALPLHSWP